MADVRGTRFDPVPHAEQAIAALDLSPDAEHTAREAAQGAAREGDWWSGRAPTGIAAAAVYAAAKAHNEGVRQEDVAAVSGTSEVTIRKNWGEVAERHLPEKFDGQSV